MESIYILQHIAMEKMIMANLKKRIKKRIKITSKAFMSDCQFSKQLAILRMGGDLTNRLHFKKISSYLNNKKDNWILSYLENLLSFVIISYKSDVFCGEYSKNAPIWVCWWTGEKSAPPLVKQCIKSIRKHAAGHPVLFISQDTYTEYLSIPDFILKKLSAHKLVGGHSVHPRFL